MKQILQQKNSTQWLLFVLLFTLFASPKVVGQTCESTYIHSSNRDDIPDYLHQVFFNIEYTEREEINGTCTVVNQKLIHATCIERDETYPALGNELVLTKYNEISSLGELSSSAIPLAATRIQYILEHYHYAPDAAEVVQAIIKPSTTVQFSGAFFTWANMNLGSYGYSTRQNMYIDVMTNVTSADATQAAKVNFFQGKANPSLQTFVEWPQIPYSCAEVVVSLNSSGLCNGTVDLTPKYSVDIYTHWDRTHTVIASNNVLDESNATSVNGSKARIRGTGYLTYDLGRSYPAGTGFLVRASANSPDTWLVEGSNDNSTWTSFGQSDTNEAVPENPITRAADWNFKSTVPFRYVRIKNVTSMTHYLDGLSIVKDNVQPTFEWRQGNNSTLMATTETYTATETGTYEVTVTVMIDGVPCQKSASVTIGEASDCPVTNPLATDNESLQNQPGPVTQQVITENDGDGIDTAYNGATLDYSTFVFTESNSQTLVVAGEGTWTFNPSNGLVTFTPQAGFTLDPTDVTYTINDSNGNTSNAATIHVDYLPVTANDSSSGNTIGSAVTVNAIANDTAGDAVDASTFNFIPSSITIPGTTGSDRDGDGDVDKVVVPGEGTWTVDASGSVIFTPLSTFTGDPTPISYNIQDHEGGTSNISTITITYSSNNDTIANNDTNQTPQDVPVSGNILWNDVDYQNHPQLVTSVLFDNNGDGSNSSIPFNGYDFAIFGTDTSGNYVSAGKIKFLNDGSYTFTPNATFTGTIKVDYTIEDNGSPIATDAATLFIDVNGENNSNQYPPIAKDDIYVMELEQDISMPILSNDSDLDGTLVPGSINLIPNPNTTSSTYFDGEGDTTYVDVDGEGIWQVNNSGVLTFTPDDSFVGDPSPISYSVEDNHGFSDTATITITTGVAGKNEMSAEDDGNYGYSGEILTSGSGNGKNVLANDIDPDGSTGTPTVTAALVDSDGDGFYDDTLTIGTATTVYGRNASGAIVVAGVVTLNSDGSYTYASDIDYVGTTLVLYSACDNNSPKNACAKATLELTTVKKVCTANPNTSGDPAITYVGISTLERNVDKWLVGTDANLGAYIALESTNKPFMITQNANPGLYKGDNPNNPKNIANPVEGMVVWDTTKHCLSLYIVKDNGEAYWKCTSRGCNE